MENTISLLIHQYLETGNEQYFEELVNRFQPLLKTYANKLYYLEKEDCLQDLTLALYEAILKMSNTENEYACISYIKKAVVHKFCKLYYASVEAQKSQENMVYPEFYQNQDLRSEQDVENCIYRIDLDNYLKSKKILERSIISLILDGYNDEEIGQKLGYTRQYINRIKKQVLKY